MNVNIAVDFPQGLVTEMYPQTSVNLPLAGKVQKTGNGHAEWTVEVQSKGVRLDVPAVAPENIWAPSRRVNSNFIQSFSDKVENERHIFYRGLGRFDGPLKVTSTKDQIFIENLGNELIPAVWVLTNNGKNGAVKSLGALAPAGRISLSTRFSDMMELELYMLDAGIKLEAELIKAGLFPLEARAMVDTWSKNYFNSFGTRVLYIAPASFPDTLLPWTIQPSPSANTRVFVGRIEVILNQEEKLLQPIAMRLVNDNYMDLSQKKSDYAVLKQLGRFAEAKIRRVFGKANDKLEKWVLKELTYDFE